MRKSLWVTAVLVLTAVFVASVEAQPGKGGFGGGFGKGQESGAEYKKLEAQLNKLTAQIAELNAAVAKLQGKAGAGKVEEKKKEEFKLFLEMKGKGKGEWKDFGKGKGEWKDFGKGFGKGPGGFKFGEGKKPGATSTEMLLKEILKEVKALRAEKGIGKGPGGFGGPGFKPGEFKKPDIKKPDMKKPEFGKGPGGFGGFGFKPGEEKKPAAPAQAGGTDQLLKEILKELKGLKSGEKSKGIVPPGGDFKFPIDGKKPGSPGKKPAPGKDDAEVEAQDDAVRIDALIDEIVDELTLAFADSEE